MVNSMIPYVMGTKQYTWKYTYSMKTSLHLFRTISAGEHIDHRSSKSSVYFENQHRMIYTQKILKTSEYLGGTS